MTSKIRNLSLAQIVFGVALLVFLFQIGTALYEFSRLAWSALTFPYPLDYNEGPVLDQTLRLASLESIYRNDFSVPPYTVTNTTPLFQVLQAPFLKLVGSAFPGKVLSGLMKSIDAKIKMGIVEDVDSLKKIDALMKN